MGMGARRHGQGGGHLPPWKCCKVFCALAVTVRRSADQLFMHYFHNFSSAPHFCWATEIWRVAVVHLVVLVLACVLRVTNTPISLPTPGKNPAGAHSHGKYYYGATRDSAVTSYYMYIIKNQEEELIGMM